MKTVNVIEIVDTTDMAVSFLTSFEENKEGNKLAEELFSQIVKENGGKETDMESYLDDGYYANGTYWVGLVHSTGDLLS